MQDYPFGSQWVHIVSVVATVSLLNVSSIGAIRKNNATRQALHLTSLASLAFNGFERIKPSVPL